MIYQLTVSTLQEYNHSQNNPFTLCITSIFLPVNDLHVQCTTTYITNISPQSLNDLPLNLSQTSLPHPSMIHPPPHNLPDLPPSLPSPDLQPSPWQPHTEHLQYLPDLLWLSAHPGPLILQN